LSWKEEAERLKFDEGKSWTEVAEAMTPYFPEMTSKQRWETVRSALRKSERYHPEKVTPKPKEKPQKIDVVQNFEPTVKTVEWKGNRIIRFALLGDTQINSKYTQITHLHNFYNEGVRRGIKHFYHTGDIDEGDQMRMGHQYECYNQGADDHVNEIVRVYPKHEGVTTHFITGNHDASITKRSGHDIGKAIADKRKDMEYLGQDCALIYLTPNCTLELRHPWDGTAYAISYKMQKMVEAMSGGEKPNILAVGHYHKQEYIAYRNVHCFQTGTFQAQTPFMRGKGIAAIMGGWIVEAMVDESGTIKKLRSEWLPYYTAIKDDYKRWSEKGVLHE